MRKRIACGLVLGTVLSLGGSVAPTQAAAQCGLPGCIQVVDTNADGDLTVEFQQAVNDVLYPGGVLTTEPVISFEAPPPGEYILSEQVRICFDTTPPIVGAETVDDCSGVDAAGAFPAIQTTGNWAAATLRCIMDTARADNRATWGCLHVGDARNDATVSGLGPLVTVDFATSPLRMTMEESGVFDILGDTMSALLCDGCTGAVGGHFTIGGPGAIFIPLSYISTSGVHLIGPDLTMTGTVDRDPGYAAVNAITFDGDVQGSGLVGAVHAEGTIMVGSQRNAYAGADDGCKYGAYDVPCRGWRLFSGATLSSEGHNGGGIWFTEWEDVHIDGEIDFNLRADLLQLVNGHAYDVKAAINFGLGAAPFALPAHGSIHFTGVCRNRGVLSECMRVFNSEANRDPAYPTTVLLDGLIDRPDPLHDPVKPELWNDGRIGGFVGLRGAEVTFGPNFQFTGANQTITSTVGKSWLTGPISRAFDVSVDVAATPALPKCVSWVTGDLISCKNPATKAKLGFDTYLAVSELTVDQAVPSDTSCALRYRVAGDCVVCEPGANNQQIPIVLESLDAISTEWSFSGLSESVDTTEFNEGTASMRLVTDSASAGYAEWTPASSLNLRKEYFTFDVWTDPAEVTDAQAFEHAHFSDTDGMRLRLVDVYGSMREWHYGGPAGGLSRVGLGNWAPVTLQHWFDTAVVDDPLFDVTQVATLRFTFNTHLPQSGRTFRLDNVRTRLREGNAILYGIEFGPIRTQEVGDAWKVEVPGRVPANHILQLEVSHTQTDSCADLVDCACNSIHATVTGGMIAVDDQGDRFNRIAQGFQPGGVCGIGFELAPALLLLLALRRRARGA